MSLDVLVTGLQILVSQIWSMKYNTMEPHSMPKKSIITCKIKKETHRALKTKWLFQKQQ